MSDRIPAAEPAYRLEDDRTRSPRSPGHRWHRLPRSSPRPPAPAYRRHLRGGHGDPHRRPHGTHPPPSAKPIRNSGSRAARRRISRSNPPPDAKPAVRPGFHGHSSGRAFGGTRPEKGSGAEPSPARIRFRSAQARAGTVEDRRSAQAAEATAATHPQAISHKAASHSIPRACSPNPRLRGVEIGHPGGDVGSTAARIPGKSAGPGRRRGLPGISPATASAAGRPSSRRMDLGTKP